MKYELCTNENVRKHNVNVCAPEITLVQAS